MARNRVSSKSGSGVSSRKSRVGATAAPSVPVDSTAKGREAKAFEKAIYRSVATMPQLAGDSQPDRMPDKTWTTPAGAKHPLARVGMAAQAFEDKSTEASTIIAMTEQQCVLRSASGYEYARPWDEVVLVDVRPDLLSTPQAGQPEPGHFTDRQFDEFAACIERMTGALHLGFSTWGNSPDARLVAMPDGSHRELMEVPRDDNSEQGNFFLGRKVNVPEAKPPTEGGAK
jgi:hypothetical protein